MHLENENNKGDVSVVWRCSWWHTTQTPEESISWQGATPHQEEKQSAGVVSKGGERGGSAGEA